MASGLGVIGPDDPPRREIIGDAGILVDVFDSHKYAEAIKSGLKKKWTQKSREQAEKFSWEKIAIEYKKIFDEL